MKKTIFIDARTGQEVPELEATDARGTLRSGFGVKSTMLFMDSAPAVVVSDAVKSFADSPAGHSAIAREAMIARLNRREPRSATELKAAFDVADARIATTAFAIGQAAADARAKAVEARDAMIADMAGGAL